MTKVQFCPKCGSLLRGKKCPCDEIAGEEQLKEMSSSVMTSSESLSLSKPPEKTKKDNKSQSVTKKRIIVRRIAK